MLDIVELGEFSAVIGSGVILELASGLAAEVASIDEEKYPFSIGEFYQAINETDGGIGFATAGSHLDKGTWSGFGEGLFQVCDGFNLAIPESIGYQRRHSFESSSEGTLLR